MGRIITGLVLITGWILLLLLGGFPLFCLVITAGSGLALYEFLRMSLQKGESKHTFPLIAVGVLPVLGGCFSGSGGMASGLFLAFVLLGILTISVYSTLDNSLAFMYRQWFGIFYIGFCSSHLVLLRTLPNGVSWLLVLTAIIVCSDTAAYYVGRKLGRTKLYPALSPGKTRAGAVGGIVGGIIGGLLVSVLVFEHSNLALIGLLSLLLSIIGIIGDLVESLIKRVSGVKDSGQILPGHGGLLDRCDSILLTAPVLYYVLLWGQAALL